MCSSFGLNFHLPEVHKDFPKIAQKMAVTWEYFVMFEIGITHSATYVFHLFLNMASSPLAVLLNKQTAALAFKLLISTNNATGLSCI